jgi:hypothetical protein
MARSNTSLGGRRASQGFRTVLLAFTRKLLLDPLVIQLATASMASCLMAIGRAALPSPWDPAIEAMVGAYDLVALASLLLRALGVKRWRPLKPLGGGGPSADGRGSRPPTALVSENAPRHQEWDIRASALPTPQFQSGPDGRRPAETRSVARPPVPGDG